MSDTGQFQTQFSRGEGVVNSYPTWSVDGQVIYYSQSSTDVALLYLVGMRYEDRKSLKEFRIPAKQDVAQGPVAQPRFSPDGTLIAYEGWPDGNHDIYSMKSNGTNWQRLTTDPGMDTNPVWRPVPPTGTH